jgi:tape measure domain-containing protein
MKNLDVGIRITADGRVLVTEVKSAQAAINQLGETAKKSNVESAAAAERFTANLKRQADTLGMTAAQVRAYDAAQLKLNDAQRASVDASNRAIAAFEKQQSAAKSNIDVLGGLKANLVAVAGAYVSYAAVMGGGRAVVETALANERLSNSLKVGTGSAELAAKEISFLRQESERLGLQFSVVSEQYAKVAAASKGTALEGQATRDIFLSVAKASTVLGLSAADTGGVLTAVQQIISKGKVSTEEILQIAERVPGTFAAISRSLDMTGLELSQVLQKGDLTAEQMLPALTAEWEKTFGAQAQEAAQGLNAKINRLDNSFTDLKTAIGNTGLLDFLAEGIVLATRFTEALAGSKTLSAIDQQKQRIEQLQGQLERGRGINSIIPGIDGFFVNKQGVDLLEQQIDDAVADLKKLENAAQSANDALSGKKAVKPGAKPALPDELVKEQEKASKAAATAAKLATDAKAREAKQVLENSQRIIEALKRETQEVGLNAVQKRMLAAATEAAKAPTKELAKEIMSSAAAWAQATQAQEASLAQQKLLKDAADERARSEKQAAEQVRQNWRNTWSQVEQNAKTAFINFAAHGKSAVQSIGEAIKFSIIDVLYQLTIRKWIINIGTSLEGQFAGAFASAASAGSGANALGTLFNGAGLLNAGKTIFDGFSSGLTGGASSIVGGLGRMMGSSALSSFGAGLSGVGTAGASAGVFSAAGGAGTAFIGGAGTAIGGTGMGAAASMGSMLSAAAGPLAAAAITTQIFRMFAGDKRMGGGFGKALNTIGDIPIIGDLIPVVPLMNTLFGRGPMKFRQQVALGTASEEGFDGRVTDVFRAKGGLFVDNKHKERAAENQDELLDLFNSTIKGFSASAKQFADNLGLSKDAITGYSKEIRLESEKGKTLTEEAIQGMLTGIGDDFARGLIPSIDSLSKSGENAFQTLTRLNTEFTSLVDAATLLGNSVADSKAFISASTFQGRTGFVDAAGGTDALMSKAQFFSDNFLTAEERLAPKEEKLNKELTRLGLSTDITKEQFGDLVKSFGHVNGITEEMLQSLLNLQGAFVDVRNAQDQLNESLRQKEIEKQQIAKAAIVQATNDAMAALQKSVDAERAKITNKYNTDLQNVNTNIQDVTESINRLKSISDALKQTVDQIRPIGRDEAKQQIQDAIDTAKRTGQLPDADSLRGALGVLGNSKTITGVSSTFEFAKEQAKTANLIADLGGIADAQLAVDKNSLAALEGRRDRLNDGFKQQIGRLDSIIEQGQLSADAMNGLNSSIVSLTVALQTFNWTAFFNGGKPIADPLTGVVDMPGNRDISRQQILDFVNTPGRTEMDIYNTAKSNNVSFVQFAAATGKNVNDLYAWATAKGLPTFASGGFHRGGLRIVGERGPELEFTGPSRIVSNSDVRNMMSNDGLERRIGSLEKSTAKILKQVARYTGRTAKDIRNVTRNGNSIRTTGVAA